MGNVKGHYSGETPPIFSHMYPSLYGHTSPFTVSQNILVHKMRKEMPKQGL